MDNSFEQQFTKNLKTIPAPVPEGPDKIPKFILITSLVLATITLIESIVLSVALANYFSATDDVDTHDEEEAVYEDEIDKDYVYDSDNNLTAFNETCRHDNGSYYTFDTSGYYKYYDSSSNLIDSGNYSLLRESIVTLKGGAQDKTLLYTGIFVADDTIIYECDLSEDPKVIE